MNTIHNIVDGLSRQVRELMSLVLLFVSLSLSLSLSTSLSMFCLEMQLTKSEIMTQYFVGLHTNVCI